MVSFEAPEDGDWTDLFDPKAIRHFSILTDEAYCVRHDREMRPVDPVIHTQGALYKTSDEYTIYTCPTCLVEITLATAGKLAHGGREAFRLELARCFAEWDQGDASGWFRYVGEGTLEDLDFGGAGT